MVSVLTCCSNDPSTNPADVYSFFVKFVFEKNENKQKGPGLAPFFKKVGHIFDQYFRLFNKVFNTFDTFLSNISLKSLLIDGYLLNSIRLGLLIVAHLLKDFFPGSGVHASVRVLPPWLETGKHLGHWTGNGKDCGFRIGERDPVGSTVHGLRFHEMVSHPT